MSVIRGGTFLVASLLLLGIVVTGVVATGETNDQIDSEHELEIDADEVVLQVALTESGDATVSTEYRIALDSSADQDAFEELTDEIEANESAYLEDYEARFGPVVADAANATDRDMELINLTVSTDTRSTVDRQYGVVTFTFTWTSFAVADGSELTAGDALAGLFLTEDTNLIIEWPTEYALFEVTPDADVTTDESVHWQGPREFGLDEPQVLLSTDTGTAPSDEDDGMVGLVFAAIVVLLVLLVAGGWYYRREASGDSAEGGTATVDASDELLSNEERVLQLVSDNDGRMKQKEVAEELGWTDAKTSKVVGNLRESGDLEAFRLGRENVLRLPEEDETL